MRYAIYFASIIIFSIFIGSQLAEALLLVPYWKSLESTAFYEYYANFGPSIGRFYTVLTILAILTPFSVSIYCFVRKEKALLPALLSSVFAVGFLLLFFFYFKNTNNQFYKAVYSNTHLLEVLTIWEFWHWLRILFEFLSLTFLCLTFFILQKPKSLTPKPQYK
ncbi:hypothetical protein [Croceivirga thetidis]|uniref:DUF1772 domain-containing protein n=1 Tax=Croceivirga thetidis TaxID=2721623 RepID=A0ABX1GPG7_9FLAO|nr:hypothetical protein [Croceivirga thetidis]NKI31823.1 hypothetical protein [Croceivirga thetidis]